MSGEIVVNGRFLRATPTGLHRAARSFLRAGRAAGLDARVVAPPMVDDPLVDAIVGGVPRPGSKASDHAWEQLVLPLHARGRPILSLANTAPIIAPTAVLVHDLAPLVEPRWFAPSMRLYARMVVAAARRATVVLAVSQQVGEELSRVGVRANRVRTVRAAVDPSFAPAPDDEVSAVREKHGLPRPYLLVVGWADPRKDTRTAALAHLVASQRVEHDLVLVGLAHPNLGDVDVPRHRSIRRLGYLRDDELIPLLTGAQALLYLSRYEGFGLPPLEAWACGTPAIVADTPSVRDATEGRAMYVVPGDVSATAELIVEAVEGRLPVPTPPAWTWEDAGRQLVDRLTALG